MSLALRFTPPAELDRWIATNTHPEVSWHPQYPLDDSLVAARMLRLAEAGDHPWGLWHILVEQGSEALVIGDIGFHGPPDPDGVVEIGYEIVPDWRRRGVATWAVRELLAIARGHGARTVGAEVVGDNPASTSVLSRCGFTSVAGSADHTLWRQDLVDTTNPESDISQ